MTIQWVSQTFDLFFLMIIDLKWSIDRRWLFKSGDTFILRWSCWFSEGSSPRYDMIHVHWKSWCASYITAEHFVGEIFEKYDFSKPSLCHGWCDKRHASPECFSAQMGRRSSPRSPNGTDRGGEGGRGAWHSVSRFKQFEIYEDLGWPHWSDFRSVCVA